MSTLAQLNHALTAVPFLSTLGIRVEETRPGHVVLRLPHSPAICNHAGAIHTGAVFTVGELAGAVALGTHPELATRRHLQKSSKIKYYLPSTKDITAHATVTPEMVDAIKNGQAAVEFSVKILDGHGQDVAELATRFAFK
jgi:uncharacterized protein (TIGR00369 family)